MILRIKIYGTNIGDTEEMGLPIPAWFNPNVYGFHWIVLEKNSIGSAIESILTLDIDKFFNMPQYGFVGMNGPSYNDLLFHVKTFIRESNLNKLS